MDHRAFVKCVVFTLIIVLSTASIVNIHERAVMLHHINSWHVWLIAIGFGLAFALSVYIVMIAKTVATRLVVGAFALIFAGITSVMQTTLYLHSGADFLTAIAFGAGVPAAEACLAIMEAMLNHESEAKQEPRQSKPSTVSRLGTLLIAAAEQRLTPSLEKNSDASPQTTAIQTETHPATTRQTKEESLALLLDVLAQNPTVTLETAGTMINRSKSSISGYVKQLELTGHIRIHDDRIEVIERSYP